MKASVADHAVPGVVIVPSVEVMVNASAV